MAYYNPNLYPFPSTFRKSDPYSFQNQTSGVGEFNDEAHGPLEDYWGGVANPTPLPCLSTNPYATGHQGEYHLDFLHPTDEAPEPVAPGTFDTSLIDGWPQQPYTDTHWPGIDQQAQPEHIGYVNRAASFARPAEQGASTMVSGPSSVPLDYWGENPSGPLVTAFGQVDEAGSSFYDPVGELSQSNVQAFYQHGYGPKRTELVQRGRFWPYGTAHAQVHGRTNAEAGPLSLVPPLAPNVGRTTSQPPGWIPERSADAENTQTITEEDEALEPEIQHIEEEELSCPPRVRQRDYHRLCIWVQMWRGIAHLPPVHEALAIAAKVVPTIRPVVSEDPCLAAKKPTRVPSQNVSMNAMGRRERVRLQLKSFLELSRYYQPKQGEGQWERVLLVREVLKDLENLYPIPGPSNESTL